MVSHDFGRRAIRGLPPGASSALRGGGSLASVGVHRSIADVWRSVLAPPVHTPMPAMSAAEVRQHFGRGVLSDARPADGEVFGGEVDWGVDGTRESLAPSEAGLRCGEGAADGASAEYEALAGRRLAGPPNIGPALAQAAAASEEERVTVDLTPQEVYADPTGCEQDGCRYIFDLTESAENWYRRGGWSQAVVELLYGSQAEDICAGHHCKEIDLVGVNNVCELKAYGFRIHEDDPITFYVHCCCVGSKRYIPPPGFDPPWGDIFPFAPLDDIEPGGP